MAKGSQALQTLLGTAMLDRQFRKQLLYGDRRALFPKYKLTDEERQFLLMIRADSLEDFAQTIEDWLETKED